VAREVPRIIVGTAVVPMYPRHPVTLAGQAKRTRAFEVLGGQAGNPSYQAILEREGISHAADLTLIEDEETVAAGIHRYLDAGATDVRVSPAAFATNEERLRTWRLVGELARDAASRESAVQA
jgi:alkanesulfonate monooxygenase SsuD/methylene tetrahydromethanopterin reductase-like flavin-dependent oxidoreductase (luciferase family)